MSEKRFVYEEEHYNFPIKKRIRDTQNNETYIDLEDVCEFLNDLNDENEQLRQQVQNAKEIAVKNDMQYQICRKEKEDFQDMCEQFRVLLKEAEEENKKLKKFNAQLMESLLYAEQDQDTE